MNINQLLHTDLYQALKDKDERRKVTLRLLMTSIKMAEVAKGSDLDDSEVLAIIQKEIKTKSDTIVDASKAKRTDLITQAEIEIKILEQYLPKQISYDELSLQAKQVISELGASSMKDMGEVIKTLIARLAGSASNQDASRAVREILMSK
ncbi:MAG: GatB/YqeY domain-containing protein [Anaerolineaceae bacterium]|nr:GatB/YqeY domain-containing protein [Anaerolineaceae bacterium]